MTAGLEELKIMKQFWALTTCFLIISIVFAILIFIKWQYTSLSFLIIQNIFLGSWFITQYYQSYRMLRDYHYDYIEKNKTQLREEEIAQIHSRMRQVRYFFMYICQNILMQVFLQIAVAFDGGATFKEYNPTALLYDLMLMSVQISNIIMCYGISLSIRKAYNEVIKSKNLQSIQEQKEVNSISSIINDDLLEDEGEEQACKETFLDS